MTIIVTQTTPGAKTLLNLRTALQTRGYSADTATEQTELLNSVAREVYSKRRWRFLEREATITTTVGVSAVTTGLPLGLHRIDSVRSRDVTLEYLTPEEFAETSADDELTVDAPAYWTYSAQQIRVWPLPSAAYALTLRYIFDPPNMSADTDTPQLPALYHDIIIWGAVVELAIRERDWNTHERAEGIYNRRLKTLIEQDKGSQRQQSGHVEDSGVHSEYDVA